MARAATKQAIRNRRKHQRLPLSIPVFVRGIEENGKEFLDFATALNVSAGGILLAMRRSLPPFASLTLEIPVAPLPPAEVALKSVRTLQANLVRVEHRQNCHLVGLKFLHALRQ